MVIAFPANFVIVDYFNTTVSLGTTALNNLPRIIISVVPHILILAAFGGFVLWNNGVVLGKCLHRERYMPMKTKFHLQDIKNSILRVFISPRCSTSGLISCSFRGPFSPSPLQI